MGSRMWAAVVMLAAGLAALCPAARSQVNRSGRVTIHGFVVTPDQQPVRNPVVYAHLIAKKVLKAAQVNGHQFHIELDGNSQDDEIEIFCSAFGTLTAVSHLSGRANHPSLTIVHRAPEQITTAVHVTEQLNALRSCEVMVLSFARADNAEWREVAKPILAASRDLPKILETQTATIQTDQYVEPLKRRLTGEARAIGNRFNSEDFRRLIDR